MGKVILRTGSGDRVASIRQINAWAAENDWRAILSDARKVFMRPRTLSYPRS